MQAELPQVPISVLKEAEENLKLWASTDLADMKHGLSEMHSYTHVSGCRVGGPWASSHGGLLLTVQLPAQEVNAVSYQQGAGLCTGEECAL